MTVPIQGFHTLFVDWSRPFWALPSPVHERSGYRVLAPDRIQGDAVLPHSFFTAQSRITSRRSSRDLFALFVPTIQPCAVLAAVKAWPGKDGACGSRAATASLDCGCGAALRQDRGRDEETARGRTKKLTRKEERKKGRKKKGRKEERKEERKKVRKEERKRSSRRCLPLDFSGPIQGWVERSETHRSAPMRIDDGFRVAQPILRRLRRRYARRLVPAAAVPPAHTRAGPSCLAPRRNAAALVRWVELLRNPSKRSDADR